MRFAMGFGLLVLLLASATAGTSGSDNKQRLAAGSADACLANCANQNASCKRVCPTTLSTPCLSNCDSQMQTCTQGCRSQ
jgi:hypothetical protein